jgi:hypothetical protein
MQNPTHSIHGAPIALLTRFIYAALCSQFFFGAPGLAADDPVAKERAEVKKSLSNMGEFRSKDFRFSIAYPKDWVRDTSSENNGKKSSLFQAHSKGHYASIVVLARPTPAKANLEKFVKSTLDSMKEYFDKKKSATITVVSKKNSVLDGNPACELIVSSDKLLTCGSESFTKHLLLLVQGKDTGLTIMCSTKPDCYSQYQPLFQAVVKSVRLSK